MSFDGLFTRAMVAECAERLVGGRITKIHQPFPHDITVTVRANGKNDRLLLSAHPTFHRFHITEETLPNPQQPSLFCMVLRKHLEGGILEEVTQHGLDRIVTFVVKSRDELGDWKVKWLRIELMGRHSNLFVIDAESGKILDAMKHLSLAVNRHRTVLPGQPYVFPPAQDKRDPLLATEEEIARVVDYLAGKLDKQLIANWAGLSPLLAKEIVLRAGLANRETLPKAFVEVMTQLREGNYEPTVYRRGEKEGFYLFPLRQMKGSGQAFATVNEAVTAFYRQKAERDRMKQRLHDLERVIRQEKERSENKIPKLKATLEDGEKAATYQLFGELLTAHMHEVKRGMKEISVLNYYDEDGGTVTIPLDENKQPAENAQRYFRKYQKAKLGIHHAKEQLDITERELDYFEGLLQQMEVASHEDVEDIREELTEQGYLRDKQKNRKVRKPSKPSLTKYTAPDGTSIYVGKNNKQNEYVTMKFARKQDWWFHTKDIPGSHVVIREQEPSEEAIHLAAELAAYFSKARASSSVPVDTTKIASVWKPNGAKPGYVTYEGQQTLYVTPDEEKILGLKSEQTS
ncbi:Rqc2 family fibronectin-binding protein [Bacillus fonticola]|uniref:Rqc2 family fibronectin-binding protein n=1 Tax=Bacillus fonticola TaxID=2728853 RepID=UPI001474D89E|nr:NFACT RNA binding domain-containing protein [Bacillus fonticola]